jgi:antagonist of KipI
MQDIEILKAGLFTTIQDHGRKNTAHFALPQSGAMDMVAAEKGNLLVDNPLTHPVIECTLLAPSLLFHKASYMALTGADMDWKINGSSVDRYKTIKINAGDILSGKASRNGCRAYIAIHGKFHIQEHYGSCATYVNAKIGGLEGRTFVKGDNLQVSRTDPPPPIIQLSIADHYSAIKKIYFDKGPEWNLLTDRGQENFNTKAFTLSAASNRMGARLLDNPIEIMEGKEMSSVPVFPGIIQIPHAGDPIVILQDGQTTGGYPRIGIISRKELDRFNQILPNTQFHFVMKD